MTATELPKGYRLSHATLHGDAVREAGAPAVSRMGESGPGAYLTDDPATAAKYLRSKQSIAADNPATRKAELLHFQTTQPLRMLDRTTPEGEELHRTLQRHPETFKELEGSEGIARYREAGFHGVIYPGVGKDSREVVVHDPLSHLRLEQFGEHL